MSKRRAELQEREGGFLVNEILSHKWIGRSLKFLIKWDLRDKSWISRTEAKHLETLDIYLEKLNVRHVKDLPKVIDADIKQEESETEDQVENEDWALTERDSCKMEKLEQEESEESEDKVYNSNEDDNLNAEAIDFTTWTRFSETYPQYNTHHVRMCIEAEAKVSDFIGGALPRKDKGNYEDYCMIMLTLFKPWRTGQRSQSRRQHLE